MRCLLLLAAVASLAFPQARIYVADTGESRITVIDPEADRVVGQIQVSAPPRSIAASADGRRLYVSSSSGNVLDVIDRRDAKLTRTIPVGPEPGHIAITPDGRRLYVCIGGRPSLDIIDTASFATEKTIELGAPAQYVAVTPDGTRIIALSRGKLTVINIRTEEPEFEIPVNGVPVSLAFDSDRYLRIQKLMLLIGGQVEVIDYASRKLTGKAGSPGVRGIAISPDHGTLWETSRDSVAVFSLPELKHLATIPVGADAESIVFSPDGRRAFVSNSGADSVSAISTTSYKELVRIPVGKAPKEMLAAE